MDGQNKIPNIVSKALPIQKNKNADTRDELLQDLKPKHESWAWNFKVNFDARLTCNLYYEGEGEQISVDPWVGIFV